MKFDPSRENLVEFLKFYSLVWFSMVWYGLVWSVRLKIHNHQSVSQSVTKVGIELLGQLKNENLNIGLFSAGLIKVM